MDRHPTWQLVVAAARVLHTRTGEFRLDELIREVQRIDPSRERGSISPVVQGMTINASGGPASPCGKPLYRVAHGLYALTTGTHDERPQQTPVITSPVVRRETIIIAGSVSLDDVMRDLALERPVFHSEADFQLAIARQIQIADPAMQVRLETSPAPGLHLDIACHRPDLGRWTAIELKYLTRAWTGNVRGERFELKSHGAQDIRGYDVVKDICRVEQFVRARSGSNGAVIVLTNSADYWRPAVGERDTNAAAFRLHDGSTLSGLRAWGPRTGVGTMRGRETALELKGTYTLRWADYAILPDSRSAGAFRYLAVGGI